MLAMVKIARLPFLTIEMQEVVYVTIGNPAFCLVSDLNGVHFRSELHHVGDVIEPEIKYLPIRTQETGGARLSEELYVSLKTFESRF